MWLRVVRSDTDRDMSWNQLTGSIPSSIIMLKSLGDLYPMTPLSQIQSSNLTFSDVSNNDLSGEIPEDLATFLVRHGLYVYHRLFQLGFTDLIQAHCKQQLYRSSTRTISISSFS